MKRVFFVGFICISILDIGANDIKLCVPYEIGYVIFQSNDAFFFKPTYMKTWHSFNKKDLRLGSDGYYRAIIYGYERIFFYGGNHAYLFRPDPDDVRRKNEIEKLYTLGIGGYIGTVEEARDFVPDAKGTLGFSAPDWGIKKIEATSYLKEKLSNGKYILYKPDNIHYRLFWDFEPGWMSSNLPWVEGKNDEGIGETLTVTFKTPVNSMLVLNGYVQPEKLYLFKANNRVKKALIKSNTFEFEYTFNDLVELSEINFPDLTDKVQIIIKEVYKGNKWNDTVITAIMRNREISPSTIASYSDVIPFNMKDKYKER